MTTTNRRLLMAANRPIDVLRKFTFDRTGGDANINTCTARIKRLRGNTIVWNQLSQTTRNNTHIANFNVDYSIQNGILHVSTDSYTYNSAGQARIGSNNKVIPLNHKILIKGGKPKIGLRLQGLINIGDSVYDFGNGIIYNNNNADETLFSDICIRLNYNYGDTFDEYLIPQIFDLTLMFGAGNEPTSVAEFEKLFPLNYYEYNAGELLSFNGDSIKAVGFNQFDLSKAEVGYVDTRTGEIVSNTTTSHSEYIPVFPNTSYYCLNVSSLGRLAGVIFFDAQKNLIKHGGPSGDASAFSASGLVTTPNNARYVRLNIKTTDVSISSVCFNLSDPLRNGTYEPYVVNTKDISFYKSIKDGQGNTLFPYGLLSTGSVYDEVTATKAIKRIGAVDMGSLTWAHQTAASNHWRFYSGLSGIKRSKNNSSKANLVCPLYKPITPDGSYMGIKGVTIASNANTVFVCDENYTTAANFKTAMNGVMLYYELAEPIEVDIDEQNLEYPAYRTGTEELLPANGAVPTTTPALFDIRYKIGGRRN